MLRVTMKGSIVTANGVLLRPGTSVPRGVFTDAAVRTHIESGYLTDAPDGSPLPQVLPEGGPAVKEDNVGRSRDAGMTAPADVQDAQKHEHGRTMVAGVDMSNARGEGIAQGAVKKVETEAPVGDKLISPGKWGFDPADLLAKDLDTLNLMVLDIDEGVAPLESVEEAIAFLSMDWKGAPEE